MKKIKMFLYIGSSLILIQLFICRAYAGEAKKFQVGFLLGPTIPQDNEVQGYNIVSYSNGAPQYASVTGFGIGSDLDVSIHYYISNWGIQLRTGVHLFQNKLGITYGSGIQDYFENDLTLFPVTLSLIGRIPLPDTKFTPYMGMGSGIMFTRWEEKHMPKGSSRTWLKGSAHPADLHFLVGFSVPIYYDILFNGEMVYSYDPADISIKNVDSNNVDKYNNLNIGGVSLNFGLAFRF